MKIAQLVSPLHSVSADANNAIYSHAGTICDGLVAKGHEVTLYASGDSSTKANLVSVYPKATSQSPEISERKRSLYFNLLAAKCYENANNLDIIHSHFTLTGSFFANLVETPTAVSIHSPIDEDVRPFLNEYRKLHYISFSLSQRKQMPELNWFANIYHGVDTNKFAFNPTPEDYFFYLGRLTEEKGVHLAIEAAKAAGVKLVIAGRSYPTEGYWHSHIEKNIDGANITYIGEQGVEEKIKWLQGAKALLFPTQYQEQFGYVMIEAMSCGTPVIGWNNGAVPEVIQDGRTGYVVNSVEEMIGAIQNIDKISREETRKRAEIYFSVKKMVSGYQKVYQRIIEESNFRKNKSVKLLGEVSPPLCLPS
jgi:glycosyltransferase involved in cell wall biosynthesis